jgi:hypothetical protein
MSAAWRRAATVARCWRISGTARRCTGRALMRQSTRCGMRSGCRCWCCAPGRRSCRGSGSSCPPWRRPVRGGGAIGTRGGDRREPLHHHHARRFHCRHRCVPAHQLTPPGEAARRSPHRRASLVPSAQWLAGTSPQTQNSSLRGAPSLVTMRRHHGLPHRSGARWLRPGCRAVAVQPGLKGRTGSASDARH